MKNGGGDGVDGDGDGVDVGGGKNGRKVVMEESMMVMQVVVRKIADCDELMEVVEILIR